ncbi:hypothetical protein [Methylomicrobium lacus]|uniref:hypothetical protein n=1 Tax=Methylomicrobium lacus TaxID=136992 RepID=UPI0035A9632B
MKNYFIDNNSFLNQIYDFVGLGYFDVPKYEDKINENAIKTPPPDEESISRLQDFFEPYNKKLFDVLGKGFDW